MKYSFRNMMSFWTMQRGLETPMSSTIDKEIQWPLFPHYFWYSHGDIIHIIVLYQMLSIFSKYGMINVWATFLHLSTSLGCFCPRTFFLKNRLDSYQGSPLYHMYILNSGLSPGVLQAYSKYFVLSCSVDLVSTLIDLLSAFALSCGDLIGNKSILDQVMIR